MEPVEFTAEVIEWRGPAPFIYARIPPDIGAEIAHFKRLASYGWGVIPVLAEIGGMRFTTSLFPREGTYLLPLKLAIRRPLGIAVGDHLAIRLTIGGSV